MRKDFSNNYRDYKDCKVHWEYKISCLFELENDKFILYIFNLSIVTIETTIRYIYIDYKEDCILYKYYEELRLFYEYYRSYRDYYLSFTKYLSYFSFISWPKLHSWAFPSISIQFWAF